ncbi:MAG: carboxypeptidase-like regulatory domain-containing protein, partial [Planctomycetota bacterium]
MIAPVGAQQDLAKKPTTGTVAGRVVDALGKPVLAAEVWVTDWYDGARRLGKTQTDGEGMFVLPRLPLSDKLLRVQATTPDRIVAHDGVRLSKLQPRDTAYLQLWDAAPLRGRVVD